MDKLLAVGILCFCAGVWFADWAWKFKIREKVRTGFRLEINGRLYEVRDAHSANPVQEQT